MPSTRRGMPIMICKHCPATTEYFDDDDLEDDDNDNVVDACHHGMPFTEGCARCGEEEAEIDELEDDDDFDDEDDDL
jgi:hypothetical protein